MKRTNRLLITIFVAGLSFLGSRVWAAEAELKVGDKAPEFSLPGSDGKTYALADFKDKKAVILAWFPKAFTGGCTKECKSIHADSEKLKPLGVAYFTASVDTAEQNEKFAKSLELDYPILSDPEKKVAETYGVVHGDRKVAERWTFYIDKEGTIREIDKDVQKHTESAGQDIASKVKELKLADAKSDSKSSDSKSADAKAIELFNGKDLTGWGLKGGENCDGKTATGDRRFTAEDGMLVVHPRKKTEPIEELWTNAKFPGDFELRLEFKASVNSDSGLFIRGPQLQVRDYLVAGPYKELKKYKPQEWNEIVVIVKGTTAHCECNGEVLEDALKIPDDGGIGLEADRNEMDYRNIRLTKTSN